MTCREKLVELLDQYDCLVGEGGKEFTPKDSFIDYFDKIVKKGEFEIVRQMQDIGDTDFDEVDVFRKYGAFGVIENQLNILDGMTLIKK